jgi:putative peptidoglycan lipid II flippase
MLRSARLIGALTLVSRILGLVRDISISSAFGVGSVSSAFWTAFQIPNLFRRLFGEGALSAASIPVLTETLANEGHDSADRLAGRIMGLLMALLAGICIVGEFVVLALYWRYRADNDSATVLTLTGLMLPYLIFICGAALLGGVQNVFNRFASAASAPIILNVFMIAATVGGRWYYVGRHGAGGRTLLPSELYPIAVLLSAAVVVSGIFQLAWQWAATRRCGLRLPLSVETRDPAVRKIAITMLPMVIGLATVQVNTLADSLIAWWCVPEVAAHGSSVYEKVGPAVLSLAQRLYQFPLGVFATALATAIFPALSRSAANKDMPGLARTLSRGIRVASFEGIPCLVGLIAVREPLIRTFFAHGEFLKWPQAVDRVSLALFMYALGIWAFGVNQVIVRAFYALQDAKTPLWISVRNVFLNLVLMLILVRTPLQEAGLALATSACAIWQVIQLLWKFDRRYVRLEWAETGVSVLRTIGATILMGVAVYVVGWATSDLRPFMHLMIMVAVGAGTYLAAAWVLRCEEMREMLRR